MNDLKVILSYEIKMKIRQIKSMIRNLFTGFILVAIVSLFIIFQFGKIIILNQELINFYKSEIFLAISLVFIVFTLTYKIIPLECHPASMVYLLGSKFHKIFQFSLIKKNISYIFLSLFMSLVLNNFKINLETIQVFLSFWTLFIISLTSRYLIYNKGINIRIVSFILIYISILNLQMYLNKYIAFIIILVLISISILAIKRVLNTDFNFDKSFNDMVFINRANSIATGNAVEDAQEFVRETLAEKNRGNIFLKKLNIKNPLIQKNLITFSRINLTLTFYIFGIFIVLILLYRFEFFQFVKTIKELGLGIPILVFHQAVFVNNILTLIIDQKKLLVVKSKEGLYLPYSKYEIIKSFMVLGVPLLLITTLIVGIILQKPLWLIFITVFLYSIILAISLFVYPIYSKQRSNFFEYFIYFIILGISYLLIGLI